jgi:hypothetical protein
VSDGTFRVSPWQLAVLVFTLGLCVTPFSLPAFLDPELGRHAWLPGLPGTGVGLYGTAVAVLLARRWRGRPFDRTALDLLGPYLGYPYLVALALLLLTGAPLNLYTFASVSGSRALRYLPLAYPAFMVAGTGAFAAYFGAEVVARCAEALAPFAGLGLAFVYASPLSNAQLGYLLPLGGVPWERLASPHALATLGTVRGFLPLLLLGPFCRPAPRTGRLFAATAAAGALVTASLALPVAVFGAPLTAQLHDPFVSAAGTVGWSWLPTERIVELTLLVWQAIAFVVFATYLWLAAWLLRRLAPRLPWAPLVALLGAAGGAAAAVHLPSPVLEAVIDAWNGSVVLLGVLVPTVLWWRSARRSAARPRAEVAG